MKIPNRSAIFIALSAIVCLSVVGLRVFAQSGSARGDAFTLTLANATLTKHKDDTAGFKAVLDNAKAQYCVNHRHSDNSPHVLNNTSAACNPPTASVRNDRSEIILVDDQASGSTSPGSSVRGPSVTQTISTSKAGDMKTILSEFE